jgi:SNF2 family DNA or RNA helicase
LTGLGKTRQLLESAEGETLIVGPQMVLSGGVWSDEHALWRPELSLTQAAYTGLNARKTTIGPKGKPGSKPVNALRDEFKNRRVDTLIFDEAHYLKGRDTYWGWAARQLAKRADRVYLSTADPIPNYADEAYALLQLIYPDEAKPGGEFGSYWRWASKYFDTTPTRWSKGLPSVGDLLACRPECLRRPTWDPCEHYLDFAKANFGDRFLRRLRSDVLDLPLLTERTVQTPMVPDQKQLYQQLRKQYVAWARNGKEIVAWNSAALNVQLLKACVGLEVLDAGAGSGKLQQLRDDLADRRGQPTLVFAHFHDTLEACAAVARALRVDHAVVHGGKTDKHNRKAVRRFKEGRMNVLFGSLELLAEGHTLVAADLAIFVERSYKVYRNRQALRRLHRLGQTRPVTAITYETPNSLDSRVTELLATKTDRALRHLKAAELARLL